MIVYPLQDSQPLIVGTVEKISKMIKVKINYVPKQVLVHSLMSATFIFPIASFKSLDAIEYDTCLCGLGSLKITC